MLLTLQSCGQDTEGLNEAMRKAIARHEVKSFPCQLPVMLFAGSVNPWHFSLFDPVFRKR
jgi:hypothetical protein